jgi:hypothetical protein
LGRTQCESTQFADCTGMSFAGSVLQTGRWGSRTGLQEGDHVVSLVQIGANSRHLCIGVKVPDDIKDPCAVACLPEIY